MAQVDLSGRVALVTGAASGIGAACARALSAAGARVVLVDRDERVHGVAADLGGASEGRVVDLTDLPRLAELEVCADILVNNAGVQHVAPVEEFPPEMFHRMLTLMVEAPFLLVRRLLPGMYERGWGRIVHISSVHGLRASAYKSAYVTAKHGVEGLSKVLALEGGPRGVTSNTVCPAYVRTPLVENQIAAQAATHGIPESEVVEKIMLTEPAIKRLIEPAEVAEAVLYLCSGAASFVNGTSLVLDGGWTAR
ncbi:3-hydroxybutyrate dehydrogenase [Phytohabitans sp. ZYX-F-186]|uniref:3-hydroxybutyrate dehydrogenase n=1 Tax=Phytohabitans maris TaxID=3071409 RepID=A0ABU0Z979_9ACTN|nr:3-hydroxybutyrate dehydrogenase [Phytohabitans sp. ZYX-F-186]MDQ7903603.1 3-hydroxybutyrate dehydrogenase [Phytohabitans sp. ZYX-F-186]